jgi:hypothetical protein
MKIYTRRVFSASIFCAISFAAFAQAPAAIPVTYGAGPNFCSTSPGYIDYPYCTIPGEIPLGSFALPAIGGSYTDPNFGGVIRVMTGFPYIHPYATPSPLSAHNKYLHVLERDTFSSRMLDVATAAVAFDRVPFAGGAHVWDANDDDVYYILTTSQIIKHRLSTNTDTVVVDYSNRFSYINAGGSTDTSKDNWLSFWAPNEHNVCAVDLNAARTYCADYTAPHADSSAGCHFIDYSLMTRGVDTVTGKRYVLLMASPALGVWSVNLATGNLDYEYRGPEYSAISQGNRDGVCDAGEPCLGAPHADVMEDSSGKQYLVSTQGNESPCELDLVTYALSAGPRLYTLDTAGGGLHRVMNLANCGTSWPDFHIGCAKSSPYCVFSSFSDVTRTPADLTTPFPAEPHRTQLIVMRGNGDEIRVLAHARSVLYDDDGYFSTPRAAMSNDGAYVVFDSNFGVDDGERVNLLETGFGSTTVVQPPPPPPPPTTTGAFSPIRVNAGGAAYMDSKGSTWAADSDFTGGAVLAVNTTIRSTADSDIYRTARTGASTYTFTVPNGNYRVNLKWAEDEGKTLGQRKFNITINGSTVLSNFDIIAAIGSPYTAVDKSFRATVSNGVLNIGFVKGSVGDPTISGIEILQQ